MTTVSFSFIKRRESTSLSTCELELFFCSQAEMSARNIIDLKAMSAYVYVFILRNMKQKARRLVVSASAADADA